MPNQIFELFGHRLDDKSIEAETNRKTANCPYMNGPCDGGGNRNQTIVEIKRLDETKSIDADFKTFYNGSGLTQIVPGVCSIKSEHEMWIVCPRRLFGFKHSGHEMQRHEWDALLGMDLPRGIPLGIWSEVKLNWRQVNEQGENETFDYTFDYVIAPVVDITAEELSNGYDEMTPIQIFLAARYGDASLKAQMRSGTVHRTVIRNAPILDTPIIVEVMTASTSGSSKHKGTDIATVFKKAIIQQEHISPGINKRQVWGRMSTQLFSKSAAAEQWGGKTYWLLQDQFLAEIERSTRLSIQRIDEARQRDHEGEVISSDAIHLSIFDINRDTGDTCYRGIVNGHSGLSYKDVSETFLGIILPNAVPPKAELLKAMLRSSPAKIFTLSN